jgi:catecholate siderophore receptor
VRFQRHFFVNGSVTRKSSHPNNAQSVEVLKGPSAITFGWGAGGGLEPTLKEADGNEYTRRRLTAGTSGTRSMPARRL